MSTIYGVARISTGRQNIERQVRNILKQYPNARIIKETYTGTKLEGRKDFENLLKILNAGDTLVFDSVSRMSRNATEGFALYQDLFYSGIDLIFLKEPHVNSAIFRKELEKKIELKIETDKKTIDEFTNGLFELVNNLLMNLAKEQIKLAFEQSEKEVQDLHQRTKERYRNSKISRKTNRSTKRS